MPNMIIIVYEMDLHKKVRCLQSDVCLNSNQIENNIIIVIIKSILFLL